MPSSCPTLLVHEAALVNLSSEEVCRSAAALGQHLLGQLCTVQVPRVTTQSMLCPPAVAFGQRAPNRAGAREQGRGMGADLQGGLFS